MMHFEIRQVRAPRIADRTRNSGNHFNLIRMVAATGVMVSHAFPLALGIGTPEPLDGFLKGSNLGTACVYVFFAISGFFITRSFDRKRDPKAFLLARALRIYPGLILMLAVMLTVFGLWVASDPGTFWHGAPRYALARLTFFKAAIDPGGIFQDNPYPGTLNGSLWSLAFEVLCYLGVLFAGMIRLFGRLWLTLVLAGIFLILYLIVPDFTQQYHITLILQTGLPFIIGALFYTWRYFVPLSLPLAVALAAAAYGLRPTPLFTPAVVLALSYATFCLGFARIPRLLAYNRLGDFSYGTYIYAFPIQQLAAFWGFTTPLSNFLVAFPLTLGCAILSWKLVEERAMRLRPSAEQDPLRSWGQS